MPRWARRSLAYFGSWKVDIVFTKIMKELAGSGLHRVLLRPADASTASAAVVTAAHRVASESVENQFRSPARLSSLRDSIIGDRSRAPDEVC